MLDSRVLILDPQISRRMLLESESRDFWVAPSGFEAITDLEILRVYGKLPFTIYILQTQQQQRGLDMGVLPLFEVF